MKLSKIMLCTAAILGVGAANAANYGEALQKSIYFYEAQQSGPIPSWNRNEWRGDSAINDGSDVGVDLTGGWYDAGDHVKFGFPMAATATMLAWGVVEYPEAYEQTGQMIHIKNNLRFVADYFVKAHSGDNEFYAQVGDGTKDHAWWGAAEVMQMARPSAKVDSANPGSDIAGETAAALAAIAMIFEDSDPSYAAKLLSHAKQLYSFADQYRGKYSDAIPDVSPFYNSWSGYQDELVWGAIWLYRATGEESYLAKAKQEYQHLGTEPQTDIHSYKWGQAWDDKSYGSYVLMAKLTDDPAYKADAERWLDYWTTGYEGKRIRYTPGGLAFLDTWGAARYTSNTSFLALVYSDYLKSSDQQQTKATTYYDFAVSQLEYILGDNPLNVSYQIGYGDYHPTKPHHRTAHGAWNDQINSPVENRHLLVGALVGGPGLDDSWEDDRADYVKNEVATDYNAGFTSALARLWLDFGGTPLPEAEFPAPEQRDTELYIDAKVNSEGTRHIEMSTRVHNHTAWPARLTNKLSMRYFIDLSEVFTAGYDIDDVSFSTAYDQSSGISGPHPWGNPEDKIYYGEVSFEGIDIYPGGQSASKKEVQFRFALPSDSNLPEWDNSNDPSWDNYTNAYMLANNIALYDDGKLVWGSEPSPACGEASGINCPPTAQPLTTTTAYNTPVSGELDGSDSDGSIASYELTTTAEHGVVSISGSRFSYSPEADFFGTDSFSYVAIDDQGERSAAAQVDITVEAPLVPAVTITPPSSGSEYAPGSNVELSIDLANAEAVNIYLDGNLVAQRTGSGNVSITLPEPEGSVAILAIAVNDEQQELEAQAQLTLHVKADAQPPTGGDDLSCEPSGIDAWQSGFVINSVVINNASEQALDAWRVQLSFEHPVALDNSWNGKASIASDGLSIIVENVEYNGHIAAGETSASLFGMQGSHDGEFTPPSCSVLP